MIDQILILLEQIFIMFLLIAAGFGIYKWGMLTDGAVRELSGMLTKLIAPFVMICSFQREFDLELAKTLFLVLIGGLASFSLAIFLAAKLYPKSKFDNYVNRRMCATYSNNNFMAIPLLSAMFGSIGVFYASAHIVSSTLLTWIYTVPQLEGTPNAKPNMKKVLFNPGTISLVFGLLLFVSPWKFPDPVFTAMNYIGSLNTPVAMIVLGCFLAQTNLKSCITDFDLYKISLVRLLLIPGIILVLLLFIPLDETAKMSLLVAFSAPVAISVAMFAKVFESDYIYCTRAVALSTILSIITMPILLAAYSFLSAII